MIQRCCNPKGPSYDKYGGRGITICDRWRNSFQAFYEDMGPRPEGLTLERNDNNGHYEPDNCRWATRREQSNNTSQVKPVTISGETHSAAEWARRLGISRGCLIERIKTRWTDEQIVEPASFENGYRMITFNGETMPIRHWAKRVGLTEKALGHRIRRGWTLERAMTTPLQK